MRAYAANTESRGIVPAAITTGTSSRAARAESTWITSVGGQSAWKWVGSTSPAAGHDVRMTALRCCRLSLRTKAWWAAMCEYVIVVPSGRTSTRRATSGPLRGARYWGTLKESWSSLTTFSGMHPHLAHADLGAEPGAPRPGDAQVLLRPDVGLQPDGRGVDGELGHRSQEGRLLRGRPLGQDGGGRQQGGQGHGGGSHGGRHRPAPEWG